MKNLRLSAFHIASKQNNGNLRVMNTLWRSVVELDQAHQTLLQALFTDGCGWDDLVDEQKEAVQTLLDLGIVTTRSVQEEQTQAVVQVKKWQRVSKELSVTFAVTFACNFRCVYCIQKGNYTERPTISEETLQGSIAWIKDYVQQFDIESIYISLFGGEPTLSFKKVIRIVEEINQVSDELNLRPPRFQLVSNGYLLDRSRLDFLRQNGLDTLQVTIDGQRSTHNARRPHVSGKNTFDKIWDNVIYSTQLGINTAVLNVVDTENQKEMLSLVDFADRLALEHPHLKDHLVFYFFTVIPTSETVDRNARVLYGWETALEAEIARARRYAQEKGFQVGDPFTVEICFRESEHTVLIDPQGYLFKCYSVLGDSRYRLGHVTDPFEKLEKRFHQWVNFDPWDEECLNCPIFPICKGGCQYQASLENEGEYGHKFCRKEQLLFAFENNLEAGIF